MRDFTKPVLILCLVCLSLTCPVYARAADVDWSDPTTIDPYDAKIGDFLDADTAEFAQDAYEAYQAQDYEKAARYYLAVLRYDINDGSSCYNLACCYGLLGKADLAAMYLKRSVKAGFEDIEHIKGDPDFDKVRGEEVFDAAFEEVASLVESKTTEIGDLTHFSSPAFLECRVHLPKDYDPVKAYPLIVGLHGYGSNHNRFNGLWKRFGDIEFIYATPQAPYPFLVGNEIGYSWGMREAEGDEQWRESAALSEDYVTKVVRNLCKTYETDGVYLLGFSQGCAMTYTTGIKNPGLFDGLMCFGGWLETDAIGEEAIKAAGGMRVFIAQGKQDRMVEYDAAVKARDTLTDNGYDVTFFEFEGGHTVPEEACHKAVEWIKAGS